MQRHAGPGAASSIPLLAGVLAGAAVASAVVAVLVGEASTGLYLGAVIAAALATALFVGQLLWSRAEWRAWGAVAPLGVVVGLLGVAASGASCGVACLAIGAPVASVGLLVPDLNLSRFRRALH